MFHMGGVHSTPSDFLRVVRFDCVADVTLFKNLTDSRTRLLVIVAVFYPFGRSRNIGFHVSKWLILLEINLVNRLEMDYIEIVRDAHNGRGRGGNLHPTLTITVMEIRQWLAAA